MIRIKKILGALGLGLLLIIFQSCGASRYVTTETRTTTHSIDTLIIRDTTVIHSETLVRDYVIPPDTLYLQGQHSSATAYLDTTTTIIKGTLKEDPWIEKVVYKDRIVEKVDSVYVEVPKEIEVEKVRAPRILWWSLALNAFFLLILVLKIFLKLK